MGSNQGDTFFPINFQTMQQKDPRQIWRFMGVILAPWIESTPTPTKMQSWQSLRFSLGIPWIPY